MPAVKTKTRFDVTKISKAGFVPATRSPKRLIANIESVQKSVGKTRLALTSPGPIGYISVEIGGEEGVMDGFIPEGQDSSSDIQIARIRMADPKYPNRGDFSENDAGTKAYDKAVGEAVQRVAIDAMDSFHDAYYTSLENMRTTIVDTGTDVYQLARLADFGRLEKIPQLAYGQIKRNMAKLLDDAFSHSGNCIWIHHMKDQGAFAEGKWSPSGEFVMDGCKAITDKVQAVILLWKDDLDDDKRDEETDRLVTFHAAITASRHNADSMGQVFTNDFTFADIAMAIMPNSKVEDWV